MNIETVYNIEGWLDTAEVYLLHRLAAQARVIVEIGAYRGRSAYVMGTAAKASGGKMYSVDNYGNGYSERDYAAFTETLQTYSLTDTVTHIYKSSLEAAKTWDKPIDLLFIDGSHDYKDAKADFKAWQKHVTGVIAFHDYTDHWPGVQKFIDELVESGQWVIVDRADATVALRKA